MKLLNAFRRPGNKRL